LAAGLQHLVGASLFFLFFVRLNLPSINTAFARYKCWKISLNPPRERLQLATFCEQTDHLTTYKGTVPFNTTGQNKQEQPT
jgi:hypothetical protein